LDYFFTLSLGKLEIATKSKSTQVEAPDQLSALLFFQNISDKYERANVMAQDGCHKVSSYTLLMISYQQIIHPR
jgi:hypothetical protein